MTAADLPRILRARWLTFLLTALVVVAAAYGAIKIQKPVYQASTTVAVTPSPNIHDSGSLLTVIGNLGQITPVFAQAVETRNTRAIAQSFLAPGMTLAPATVTTFGNVGSALLKIVTNSTSPAVAQQSAEAYYEALAQRANAGQIGFRNLVTVLQIESPGLPTSPVSPRKKLTLGAGVVIGLLLGVAAAWAREVYSGKIETADSLRQVSGAPVFGEIPDSRRVPAVASTDALFADQRLRPVVEAVRDLGVALQLTNYNEDSILVTSPEGQHGKTTLAFSLALSLARSGLPTLLVDADLRRGRLEEMFSEEQLPIRKSPGLADVLRGLPAEQAIQPTMFENLSLLASGELLDDPNVIIDAAFPATLKALESRYAVVVDSTPLIPINDARIMAKFCDITLIVVAAGTMTRRQLRNAVDRLKIIGVEPTAVVLNRVRVRHGPAYHRYLVTPKATRSAVGD